MIYSSMEMINDLRKKDGKFSAKYGSELILASSANTKEILTALIAMGVDVNLKDAVTTDGQSAYSIASRFKRGDKILSLLR